MREDLARHDDSERAESRNTIQEVPQYRVTDNAVDKHSRKKNVDDYTDRDQNKTKLQNTVSADATLHLSTSDNHSTAKAPTQKAQSRGGTITSDRPTIVSFRDKVEIAKSKSFVASLS